MYQFLMSYILIIIKNKTNLTDKTKNFNYLKLRACVTWDFSCYLILRLLKFVNIKEQFEQNSYIP